MTYDSNQQIEEMNRIIATLEESKRRNGNRGFDYPLRFAYRKLEELHRRSAES